jgi:hypothetical protein
MDKLGFRLMLQERKLPEDKLEPAIAAGLKAQPLVYSGSNIDITTCRTGGEEQGGDEISEIYEIAIHRRCRVNK